MSKYAKKTKLDIILAKKNKTGNLGETGDPGKTSFFLCLPIWATG